MHVRADGVSRSITPSKHPSDAEVADSIIGGHKT
ncbi:MAG: hypothetical protein J07HQW2_03070 [Haloquadratum walsbyi J07HQW2]|uniref:Uncharacterized protein n=1 Tax=Haloquadratum walsbyi J07HQW2 TaxID=1238425 RepID=U1NHD8_9EURY|nr:MAG: hypothetical protein J07HQW2_03070 [Haloquadratum walsbyi J07HQW2]